MGGLTHGYDGEYAAVHIISIQSGSLACSNTRPTRRRVAAGGARDSNLVNTGKHGTARLSLSVISRVSCVNENIASSTQRDYTLQRKDRRIILSSSIHYAALRDRKVNDSSTAARMTTLSLRPAFVANRFNESSPSPWARTWPLSANEVEVGSARPLASTSAITICTDAWSFEVMRRS